MRQLTDTMAGQVRTGTVPGMVIGLARDGDVRICAIGTTQAGGSEPIRPDAIFRITSMTRPVTAVATLLLVQDGVLDLDEPASRLLPELADRPVLSRLDGPVTETVPAQRPVTVADLLTFRGGFGMILASPDEYPILAAEQELRLSSAGPPLPVTPHEPAEWMRLMGTLPLMDQPGTQWRYSAGSQILGVLIARAAGQSAESFYADRIFRPLGMHDTSFRVPAADLGRLVPCYQEEEGNLVPFDDEGQWARPRAFTDCGGGLAATAGDYLTFARMLLAGGSHDGGRFLAPELVAAMTTDQLTEQQRDTAGPLLDGRGWGFGLSIIGPPPGGSAGPRGYGWSGGFGTVWANDPDAGLAAVLCAQVLASPATWALEETFWTALYQALDT